MPERIDLDKVIPYEQYYLERLKRVKKLGADQISSLCPFHDDKNESFGVHLVTGKWICRAGCGEGNVISFHAQLNEISTKEAYKALLRIYNVSTPEKKRQLARKGPSPATPSPPALSDAPQNISKDIPKIIPIETLDLFQTIPAELLEWMKNTRGWSEEVIQKYHIGYNPTKRYSPGFIDSQRITIPIFDTAGNLRNIRSYEPGAAENKLMSWSTGSNKKGNRIGYGEARFFPARMIEEARKEGKILYLVEGEPDCLCGLSRGLACVTHTAGADTWKDEWNPGFKGLHIRIVFDNDEAGQTGKNGQGGMLKVIKHLKDFTKKIECVQWPVWMQEKEDLTDWFVKYSKTVEDLDKLEWLSAQEFQKKYWKTEDDGPIEKAVRELNEKHAIIMLGGKCSILNEVIDPVFGRPDLTYSSPHDFKTRYSNKKVFVVNGKGETRAVSIANAWLDHPDRREYNGIVFAPNQEMHENYNLYRGLAYKPKKGNWERLCNHIGEVVCGGYELIFNYVMAWMADAVQDPGGERPGVALVMRGGKGVGKGIFARTFGELFGNHFLHITHQSQLVGKFNNHQKDALIVFADECFWAGDKLSEGVLKAMITEPTIRVEPKGKDSFAVKNHMRVIIASNESWVVPASLGERRFLVVDVHDAHRQSISYFAPIYEEIENGGREAMLHDLMNLKYDKKLLLNAPKTDALLSQIEEGMDPVQKFWLERLRVGVILKGHYRWEDFAPTAALYTEFLEFNRNLGHNYAPAPNSFARKLKNLCPGLARKKTQKQTSINANDREWSLYFGSLDECRTRFERILGQSIQWQGDDSECPS